MGVPGVLPLGGLVSQIKSFKQTGEMDADGERRVADQVAPAVGSILARVFCVHDEWHLAWKQEAARDRGLLVTELIVETRRGTGVVVPGRVEESFEQVTRALWAAGAAILQQAAQTQRPAARRLDGHVSPEQLRIP